jgi:hypothetical protein
LEADDRWVPAFAGKHFVFFISTLASGLTPEIASSTAVENHVLQPLVSCRCVAAAGIYTYKESEISGIDGLLRGY